MKAKLFLISAASGTGKSSLINAVLDNLNSKNFNVELSISHTTRKKRGGSQDYYIFTSEDDFKNKVSDDFFLEHALVHGNFYGTSKDFVETKIAEGINIILEIDVQGVQQIKSTDFPHESIFLLPPSIESLTERLNERGTNSKESIELRLSNAMKEIPSCKDYDHILVNDVFEDCCNDLARIITGEDSFPMNSKKELFLTKLLNS